MKKFFSILAAVLFAGSMMAAEAVLQYTGGVTTNMVGDGANNAATLGLDANLFTVLADKGSNQNLPGLNKANDIRLYADKNSGNGNIITVSIASGTITSIVLDIKQTATFVVKAGETVVTEANGAYAINAASFSIQNTTTGATTQLQLNKITITYEAGEAPSVATPVISGNAEFTDSVIVTITCSTPETDIYYTTDGTTDPKCDCSAAPEYKKPIVLKETTTIMAAAYTGNGWSAVATKTFTKKEPLVAISCAEVYNKAKGTELKLNNVVVAYANGKNVYVQDETGSMLLYLTQNTTWEAGNILSGVQGTLDIYNGLYEVKMTEAQATAVQPGQGEAPAPVEFNAAPVAADMNKYIVLKNVTVSAETFPSNKNMDCTIGEESFVLRNNFNANAAFDITKKYDIIGVVAVYNSTVQVYFISAEEVQATAINNNTVADKVQKVVRDGQLYIIRDGKMINVLGAQF